MVRSKVLSLRKEGRIIFRNARFLTRDRFDADRGLDSIRSFRSRFVERFPRSSVIRFTEVCVENIRPPQIMRFRDAIHHSGRKPINRDLIPYRELHFLTPFVLFSIRPLRLFTPFSTLFVLSLSLSLSLSNSGESSYCR